MKIRCVVCGKQAISYNVSEHDTYVTTLQGARPGFKPDECYYGHCAKDMDKNGLFPEERTDAK